jgi:hypothetical protein
VLTETWEGGQTVQLLICQLVNPVHYQHSSQLNVHTSLKKVPESTVDMIAAREGS